MAVNLYLNIDDDLAVEIWRDAKLFGRTAEEELRKRLIEGLGEVWEPLTPDDIINDDRLNIMFDLRTP